MKKNRFDERYNIGIANKSDIEDIMEFIDSHWRKGHIMSIDRELFEYEFLYDNTVNFILAREKSTNEIEAIFGFLYCSNPDAKTPKDIWGSFWKVNDDNNNMKMLGIELAKRVYELTGCRYHIGNGANPSTTIPLRKIVFKEKTDVMKQYYILNSNITEFNIADIKYFPECVCKCEKKYLVKQYKDFELLKREFDAEKYDVVPYKDNWYVEKRYFKHPIYKYKVYGIYNECSIIDAIIVLREVEQNNRKILRIVDYLGNHTLFSGLNYIFKDWMSKERYEYIDFVEFGFEEEYIKKAGMVRRKDNDENIIPNYFEPFERSNVDIWVHYKDERTTFFKADGDQDRPNII